MQNRYEVIPRRQWRNTDNRQVVSVYGSLPYWGNDPGPWVIEDAGWTIRDNKRGTVGAYCLKQDMTKDEVQAFADKWNAEVYA